MTKCTETDCENEIEEGQGFVMIVKQNNGKFIPGEYPFCSARCLHNNTLEGEL